MSAAPPPSTGLVRLTLELSRLRGDPQDFPYSPILLAMAFAACVLLDLLTAQALGQGDHALAHSLVGESLVLVLCAIALRIRGLGHRYVQTATALIACSLLITVLQLPLALLYVPTAAATPARTTPGALQALIGLGFLALLAWQTLINAHIMRHAMQAKYAFALTLVVTWVIAGIAIDQILFGAA